MSSNNTYNFEEKAQRASSRSRQMAKDELKKFATRLRFKDSDVQLVENNDDLLEYVVEHHLNIDWYEQRLKKERCFRSVFTIISLVLLFLIPVGIMFLGRVSAGNPGSVTAQITAILTGLLAVHRSLSSWLDKRQLIGHFWKASAALKESLYSLEDRWQGKAIDKNTLAKGFMEDIKKGIQKARQIVKEEQENFFKLYPMPSIDLGEILKSAGTGAKTVVTTSTSPEMAEEKARETAKAARQEKIENARRKVRRLEAEIAELAGLIKEKTMTLDQIPEPGKAGIKSSISSLERQRDTAEGELVKAKAELASLN